jgi:queuine tRNA-ribosyltransferase
VTHSLFEIVTTTAGALSIRNKAVNEIMHNPVGPWREANELYVEQSQLQKYLVRDVDRELIIFDVGLGAAANALASLHCLQKSPRPVRLVSFEIDLELIRFAMVNSHRFSHFSGYEKAIRQLLEDGYWEDGHIKWELHHGDFLELVETVNAKAEIIYYDPYSPKMNETMWTTECFSKLRARCQDQAMLYTYSQSTPIRVALLEAGFYVGYGIPTGFKESTTIAACRLGDLQKPLDIRWLERFRRSRTPFPIGCKNPENIYAVVNNHKQFQELVKSESKFF